MRRIVLLGGILVAACPLVAQTTFAVEGYVTSIQLPSTFKAGGRTIVLTRETAFGAIGSDERSVSDPARQLLRVGAYVQVAGPNQSLIQPIPARLVLVRDEKNQKRSGIGVITHVVSPPPEAVYQADGYLIRVAASTKLDFADDLSSLADVTENTWIHYSGKLNANGVLEASRAQFIPAKPTKFKALKGVEVASVTMRPASATNTAPAPAALPNQLNDGASLQADQQLKVGLGRWHTIPADQPLQQRVHRVGMALVPAYQRQMDDNDPSKIHFRFFAVDDKGLRRVECLMDGAILVSVQAIERLPNDDHLAAILADGIACNLQRQAARTIIQRRKELGIAVAEILFPPASIAAFAYSGAAGDPQARLEEERLRIALALMKDAGYDPWLAPEAWRLLAPKKLPANVDSLQYPDSSCYQLGILNLQYLRSAPQREH